MKNKLSLILTIIFISALGVFAQTSWLDRPVTNWNQNTRLVPTAPRATGDAPTVARCAASVRNPESLSDRALTRAGWTLFGPAQTFGLVTVINGMASVDGMCRPNQYNTFVFISNRFIGTLSPTVMNSRTDGALSETRLNSQKDISAEYVRYKSSDALCCPSQTSNVVYTIENGQLTVGEVNTEEVCQNQPNEGSDTGVVRGTVTYRQRMALPRNSVLTVTLLDVSLADAPSTTISEQRIELNNQQVPISFEIKFNPNQISLRRRYAVRAEIQNNGRQIFTTDTNYPVLTQGNSNTVDINLVSAGSGNSNQENNSGIVRGTISYRERMALPNNSNITVKLVTESDSANVVAETSFSNNNRQVPIPFELRYNPSLINPRLRYFIQSEISIDGKLAFKTIETYFVLTQGNPTDNLQLILNRTQETPTAITGQNINISKTGLGSLQIEGRNNETVIRANVTVRNDGTADVSIVRFNGIIVFSGKLTHFDQNTLRITVENSGNADASGEIEVKYNQRRLDSIAGNNLVLDNQNVTLRF